MTMGPYYTGSGETGGLYGTGATSSAVSYFEWFIFQEADVQPATPTGGTWDFVNNTGTAPSGWSTYPPANPSNTVWVSIATVSSRSTVALVWSVPGKFTFGAGLPILSGTGAPVSGDGQSNQLWVQTGTTPESLWFKDAGTWKQLSGPNLFVDFSSTQTIGGVKTFTNTIVGSISGTADNVTGIVNILNGGTGTVYGVNGGTF